MITENMKEIFWAVFGQKREEKFYGDGRRTERVYVRVTEEEKEILEKMANCQCLDTSNFVRWLVFSKYMNDFVKTN